MAVVCEMPVEKVIQTALRIVQTGHIGDGKILVYDVGTGQSKYGTFQRWKERFQKNDLNFGTKRNIVF